MKKISLLTSLCLFLVTLDQVTKSLILKKFYYGEIFQVIPGYFALAFVKNTGAAFGMGQGGPEWARQVFFLALPVVFCFWVIHLLYKSLQGPLYMSISYTLIISGAIGNLIDRFSLGFVVDMFMFYWKKEENHFHVFNVADSCITVAAFILIYDFYINHKKSKASQTS